MKAVDSNSREEQKPTIVKGAIRIPLIHILGDNCRGFGEVSKDPQIIVRYAGVVIYQQPKVSVPSISQGKGTLPVEAKEKEEPTYRGGRDKVLLLLE